MPLPGDLRPPFVVFAHPVSTCQGDERLLGAQGCLLEVKEGELLGIIDRNGVGKSTLLRILSRITEPTKGWVEIRGHVGSLLAVDTFCHPELTGWEDIYWKE